MTIAVAFAPSTDTSPRVPGTRRGGRYTITCDTSYPTGGTTLTPSAFGFISIHSVMVGCTSTAKPCFWTGSKLKVFSAIGTEVTNATDLSAETVVVEISGI